MTVGQGLEGSEGVEPCSYLGEDFLRQGKAIAEVKCKGSGRARSETLQDTPQGLRLLWRPLLVLRISDSLAEC